MKNQFTILSTLFSLTVFAQDSESVPPPPICEPATLFDIIINSGYIGIVIWTFIFLLIFAGLIIGPLAITQCQKSKLKINPLSFRLLPIGIAFLFIFGLLGTTFGGIESFACIAGQHSIFHSKAEPLALSLSQVLYCPAFAFLGCVEYLIFWTISFISLHFKNKRIMGKIL